MQNDGNRPSGETGAAHWLAGGRPRFFIYVPVVPGTGGRYQIGTVPW